MAQLSKEQLKKLLQDMRDFMYVHGVTHEEYIAIENFLHAYEDYTEMNF